VSNRNKIAAVQGGMSVFHHSNRESERMNYLFETGRQKFSELCVVSDIRKLLRSGPLPVRFAVEYGQFTCYDFSVLDSDRHVAA
jgi:hypothetical protein